MKLVGLMLARNEDWVIGLSARVALSWCDHLVVLDHASTDRTGELLRALTEEYPNRVTVGYFPSTEWTEMVHRQWMLKTAREVGATHIAIVDADEILSGNLVDRTKALAFETPSDSMLIMPGYNLRGSLSRYHANGVWGNRNFSLAFVDSPELEWSGDQFHHREPFGKQFRAFSPIERGDGGILHLWGASERRLIAKHALYKMTERLRWPLKSVLDIELQYNLAVKQQPGWTFAEIPSTWWDRYEPWMKYLEIDAVPWQEAECQHLYDKHRERFTDLDLFGVVDTHKTLPTFSLCHTTARLPDGWKAAAQAWHDKCDHPENVEYILSVDHDPDIPSSIPLPQSWSFGWMKVVTNFGRKCNVDGWNTAANSSTGKFLINIADDLMPCEHWDTRIFENLPKKPNGQIDFDKETVLDVNTGGEPGLLPFSLMTRSFMQRLRRDYGYDGFFYPEYESVYSDTEFTEIARSMGVVVNARHLYFEHLHPIFGKQPMDEIYRNTNRPELYASGRALYEKRLSEFKMVISQIKFVIAIILPGEWFSADYLAAWTEFYGKLKDRGWLPIPVFGHGTNVYVVRACLADAVRICPVTPHLVMWLDDDNVITTQHFDRLIEDLNEHPDLDGVAGWSWIAANLQGTAWRTSCGRIGSDGIGKAYTYAELMAGDEPLKPIEFTGFPLFLMRYQALEKAGTTAFRPVVNDKHPWGFSGEDVSFSIHAGANGCKFAVDRRVLVRHQKLLDAGPGDEQIKALMEESQVVAAAS